MPEAAPSVSGAWLLWSFSQTVRRRKTPPRFIPVLGPSGAGKTVYLGMLLDMLSKGTRQLTGLVTGSFSVGLQIQTTTALEHGRFPEKTPVEAEGWQWVHCEVSSRAKSSVYADIITPDFAGESIAQEVERPGTYPAIRHVLEQAQGLLVLCDSLSVRDAALGEDLFAMKLASYLVQLHENLAGYRQSRKIDLPIAIVLTKADQCADASDDPSTFARSNLPRLLQFCERRFACATVSLPAALSAAPRCSWTHTAVAIRCHFTLNRAGSSNPWRGFWEARVEVSVMQAEQAVFTSARTARMSGYHLVARSPGVDAELAAAISLWGPTHGSLSSDDWETSAISCFRIDERWLALARTVYGGPEYSERGRQIVTLFLLMTDAQWLAITIATRCACSRLHNASVTCGCRSRYRNGCPLCDFQMRCQLGLTVTNAMPPAMIYWSRRCVASTVTSASLLWECRILCP